MGARGSVVNRLGNIGLVRAMRWLSVGAVIVGALLWCVEASAGVGNQPTKNYDVVLSYSGTLQYTVSGAYQENVSLKFSESQAVEVKFPVAGIGAGGAGTAEFTDKGAPSFTASGSLTSTSADPSSPDNCSISASNAAASMFVPNVESGSVDSGKDTLVVQAAMPVSIAEQGTPGAVVLSGTNNNCADHYLALASVTDPQIVDAATTGIEIDMSKLPYSKSFNVQSTSGGGQLSVNTKFTATGQGAQLLIDDQSNGRSTDVTNKTTRTAVGEPMKLAARFSDGGTVQDPKWSGIRAPYAIKDYIFEDGLGSVTELKDATLRSSSIDFYWIHSYAYTVTVTGTDSLTGKENKAVATFAVEAPDVKQFIARTCKLSTVRKLAGISLGRNDRCGDKPGVAWSIWLKGAAHTRFAYGVTQLINTDDSYNNRPCRSRIRPANYGLGPLADGSKLYAGAVLHLAENKSEYVDGRKYHVFSDSPEVIFGADLGHWTRTMSGVDYLMVKPEAQDSIWVAMRILRWQFSWSADYKSGGPLRGAIGGIPNISFSAANPPSEIDSAESPGEPQWTGYELGLAITSNRLIEQSSCE